VSWGTCTITDNFVNISDSWIEAHISKAVEHSSWHSISFGDTILLVVMMSYLIEWSVHSLLLRHEILYLGVVIDPFSNVKAKKLLWN
jgi:hypothetical protein